MSDPKADFHTRNLMLSQILNVHLDCGNCIYGRDYPHDATCPDNVHITGIAFYIGVPPYTIFCPHWTPKP